MLPDLLDLQERARAMLPADVFEYYRCGAGDELAAREAEEAWLAFRLRPRVLRDVSSVDVGVDLLGTRLASPIAVAPTAFHGLAHPDGELATVRGAGAAGCLAVVSARSSRLLEDIGREASGPWWYQVYVLKSRAVTQDLVCRAAAAGARALVLTGDTPRVGRKVALGGRTRFPVPVDDLLVNVRAHLSPDRSDHFEQDPSVGMEAVRWLAEISGLPVLVKGVLRADDALRCLEAGAAGIVVSNHGGRQSPRAVATARALPEVVAAVGGQVPVLVDGGIRSGTDALVALALGARAALLGRPVLWALAAGGADGVQRALGAVGADLAHELGVIGVRQLRDLDRDLVVPGDS